MKINQAPQSEPGKMCNNALSSLVTGYRNFACDSQMEITTLTKDI